MKKLEQEISDLNNILLEQKDLINALSAEKDKLKTTVDCYKMLLEKYKSRYNSQSRVYKDAKATGEVSSKWLAEGKKQAFSEIINDLVMPSV